MLGPHSKLVSKIEEFLQQGCDKTQGNNQQLASLLLVTLDW